MIDSVISTPALLWGPLAFCTGPDIVSFEVDSFAIFFAGLWRTGAIHAFITAELR